LIVIVFKILNILIENEPEMDQADRSIRKFLL